MRPLHHFVLHLATFPGVVISDCGADLCFPVPNDVKRFPHTCLFIDHAHFFFSEGSAQCLTRFKNEFHLFGATECGSVAECLGPGFDPQHSQYIRIQFHLNLRIDLFFNVEMKIIWAQSFMSKWTHVWQVFFFFPDSGLFLISTGIFQRSALTFLNPGFHSFSYLDHCFLCLA